MLHEINTLFQLGQCALNIYAKRQEILASNIANADTPGYKAMDIDFKKEIKKIIKKNNMKNIDVKLHKTSPQHFNTYKNTQSSLNIIPVISNEIKANGNTVDMNRERIEFIKNSLKYQSSLIFMNNEIKNIIHVLRG
ncbi:flagellar basal body rod protein FlgB [Buchnera aphidicola]|uniref:flagellar basal body rod protein FlgB n=1 Tax=Buchnera aphidicola TaxID=9 RepID=UPI003463BD07